MQKILELFECQIGDTTNAFPSIFSKDDVVNLLIELKDNVLTEIASSNTGITYTHEEIGRAIRDLLDEMPFLDYVECEPELCGSYGGSYSLEMNSSFNEDQFVRDFVTDVETYFKPNKEQI